MGYLERLNRILVSGLLLLVFIQVGLLFFLKSLQDEAEYRLVKNTSKAKIICGQDQFSNENYWPIIDEKVQNQALCVGPDKNENCKISLLTWKREEQTKELHLISLMSPPPVNWETMEQGGIVKVRIKKSAKPQIIALVSRSPLQWNFEIEKGAVVEKVIVATPTTVWMQGVDAKTPIEYLPKEKMCSYPYTWHDAFNPENEFRVLVSSLHQVTGLALNSFQGAEMAKEFWIGQPAALRQIASRELSSVAPETLAPASAASPLKWQRKDGHLVAEKHVWSGGSDAGHVFELPAKTTQTLEVENELYAVINGNLKVWDKTKNAFAFVDTQVGVPSVDEVQAVVHDNDRQALIVYNEQRGGEFFVFDLKTKKWDLLSRGFKYNLSAMAYDSHLKKVVTLVSRGGYFTGLVTVEADGEKTQFQEFKNKLPFDKKRWRWSLNKTQDQWHVQVFSPPVVSGQNFPLI